MKRRDVLGLLFGIAFEGLTTSTAGGQTPNCIAGEQYKWVQAVLLRMQSIKPGMTREQLLSVFTTEGGLSMSLDRTYVSRDCANFKVSVQFRAVGRPDKDADGRTTLVEDKRDVITSISRPYIEQSIMD